MFTVFISIHTQTHINRNYFIFLLVILFLYLKNKEFHLEKKLFLIFVIKYTCYKILSVNRIAYLGSESITIISNKKIIL